MKVEKPFLAYFFIMIISLTFVTTAEATGKEAKNGISIDVFMPVFVPIDYLLEGIWNVPIGIQYQRVISDHFVLLGKAGLLAYSGDGTWGMLANLGTGVEWHPFQKGLNGFHIGFTGFIIYEPSSKAYHFHIPIGPMFGWQFPVSQDMTIDVTVGLGYGYNGDFIDGAGGWSLMAMPGGIFLGYTF
jgi:hypothetical protein